MGERVQWGWDGVGERVHKWNCLIDQEASDTGMCVVLIHIFCKMYFGNLLILFYFFPRLKMVPAKRKCQMCSYT